jgi:hypothetical protein
MTWSYSNDGIHLRLSPKRGHLSSNPQKGLIMAFAVVFQPRRTMLTVNDLVRNREHESRTYNGLIKIIYKQTSNYNLPTKIT